MRSVLGCVFVLSLVYAAAVTALFTPLRNLGQRETALAGTQEMIRTLSREIAHEVIIKERILLTGNPALLPRAWDREAGVRGLIRELQSVGPDSSISTSVRELFLVRARFETVFREIATLLAPTGVQRPDTGQDAGKPSLSHSTLTDHVTSFSALSDKIFDLIGVLEKITNQDQLRILSMRASKYDATLFHLSLFTGCFLAALLFLLYLIHRTYQRVFVNLELEVEKLGNLSQGERVDETQEGPSGKVRSFINNLLDLVEFGRKEREGFSSRMLETVAETEKRFQADITNLEEACRELGYVAEYYEGIVSSITDGIMLIEPGGLIVSASPVAQSAFLGNRSLDQGISLTDIFPGSEAEFTQAMTEIMEGRPTRLKNLRLEGKYYSVKLYPSRGRDRNDGVTGATAVIDDISNLVVLENRVARSERLAALGQLSAGVAHEIKNPLAGMQVAIELALERLEGLQESDGTAHSSRATLLDIQKEIVRLDGIVDSLLDFARPSSREGSCDAAEVVSRALRFMDSSLSNRGIRVTESIQGACLCPVDETRLSQVVLNLLVNAMDAMESGGELGIGVTCDQRETVISVSDSGRGIKTEDISRIFDPFFTTKSGGTGLGLSISYNILRDVGGHISVESEEGRGATFLVRVPLQPTFPES